MKEKCSRIKPAGISHFILAIFVLLFTSNLHSETVFADKAKKPPFRPFISFKEVRLPLAPGAKSLKIGDLNGDGAADILFVTPDASSVWVSLGDNSNFFSRPERLIIADHVTGTVMVESIIVKDLNRDGRDEILFVSETYDESGDMKDVFTVYHSTFENRRFSTSPYFSFREKEGRFRQNTLLFVREGRRNQPLEIILGSPSSRRIRVARKNKGEKRFAFFDYEFSNIPGLNADVDIPEVKIPGYFMTVDLDGDGIADAMKVGNESLFFFQTNRRYVYGGGWIYGKEKERESRREIILTGYLDGDNEPDLVVVNTQGKGRVLIRGKDGKWRTTFFLDFRGEPIVKLGDFNGDGADDVIFFIPARGVFSILLNDGTGHMGALVSRSVSRGAIEDISVFDMNGDGFDDLVVLTMVSGRKREGSVYLNVSR